jgi:hypothetical protein
MRAMKCATSSPSSTSFRRDAVALSIKAADEANLVEQVFGRIADEVEDAVFCLTCVASILLHTRLTSGREAILPT